MAKALQVRYESLSERKKKLAKLDRKRGTLANIIMAEEFELYNEAMRIKEIPNGQDHN